VKGRFFDRLDAKLNRLARFDSNELVSIDLQAMATALFGDKKRRCDVRPARRDQKLRGDALRGAASTVCDFRCGFKKATYQGGDTESA
jgi:hypothetical protein